VNTVVFCEPDFDALISGLKVADDGSECAAIIRGTLGKSVARTRYIVNDIHMPEQKDYEVRTPTRVDLRPEFFVPLIRSWRGPTRFVGFVHTHPASRWPSFSQYDDASEARLSSFLRYQFQSDEHVSVVVGTDGCVARRIGTTEEMQVSSVGRALTIKSRVNRVEHDPRFDRQVTALGADGQAAIRQLMIGIVGLGGTGSAIAQLLGLLGVERFTLVDFDTVDPTNLNRLVGASASDVGRRKVAVAAAMLARINPATKSELVAGDVGDEDTARRLISCDMIFGCTDSHGSRAVLNQIAHQYLIPTIDMGVVVHAAEGELKRVAARIQLLSPTLGCLTCGSLLDPDEVRRDLSTRAQRQHDPYMRGAAIPQPAVASINSTAASLAATMFLSVVTGFPAQARLQLYDAIAGTVRAAQIVPVPGCVVCSSRGASRRGDTWPLPTRPSSAHGSPST
jgi:molybdopterin-synthase adenylyltransferase